MLVQDVRNCSFDAWYPDFEKVTLESRILPIPPDVLKYLKPNDDNGLFLPIQCDDQEEGTSDDKRPSFPVFCNLMKEAIDELGGQVLPKLNWSCPKDASWMGFARSLKCTSISDIFLLLKSSEFICHDLVLPFTDCQDFSPDLDADYVLVLRRWSDNINKGGEFR